MAPGVMFQGPAPDPRVVTGPASRAAKPRFPCFSDDNIESPISHCVKLDEDDFELSNKGKKVDDGEIGPLPLRPTMRAPALLDSEEVQDCRTCWPHCGSEALLAIIRRTIEPLKPWRAR